MGIGNAVVRAIPHAAVGSGIGALAAGAGTALLNKAGHHQYKDLVTAGFQGGAVGGSIIAGGLAFLTALPNPEKPIVDKYDIGGAVVSSVFYNMAGQAVLKATNHVAQAVGQSAATGAVGAAVVWGGTILLFGAIRVVSSGEEDALAAAASKTGAFLGSFRPSRRERQPENQTELNNVPAKTF